MSAPGERNLLEPLFALEWRPILGGTAAASGLSMTLHAFAVGIGLAVASTAPTWRDSSSLMWALSGIYLLFVAIAAFATGGYIAARMRNANALVSRERECSDGIHGIVMWGTAILVTAFLALGTAALSVPAVAPSGSVGATQSVAGENTIAIELDELFRDARDIPNLAYHRAEASRILLKAGSHSGVLNPDRAYLTELTARITGANAAAATQRVNTAITATRDELRKARVAAVLQACFIGLALMVGAAVAWFAAVEGGKDREAKTFFSWSR